LTDELPELSTKTKPPERPAAAWPELAAVVGAPGMLIGVLSAVPIADPGKYWPLLP
jgi:hypothetical protein